MLTATYSTTDAAVQGIAKGMEDFYESKYPDAAKTKQLEIRKAVAEVQQIFKRTTFPEMKLNWQTHPNNLGTLLLQRMLPLPRRPACQHRWQSHQPGMQSVPYAAA